LNAFGTAAHYWFVGTQMLQTPCYRTIRPSSRVSESNAQLGVREWYLEFIS
jgi:hypothetical protein